MGSGRKKGRKEGEMKGGGDRTNIYEYLELLLNLGTCSVQGQINSWMHMT